MNQREWEKLVQTLRGTNVSHAVAAAAQLHKIATAEDLVLLKDLLKDDNFFVREAAAWPVSELAGPSAIPELLVAYQRGLDEGHDNDGFSTALIDLVEANREVSREVLRRLMETSGTVMRENALWLLGFCVTSGDT